MKLTATSKLNIALHIIPIAGFAYLAYLAFRAGNSFIGGFMAACSLMVFIDFIACIKARIKERQVG